MSQTNVMIVDDEPDFSELLKTVLEDDYSVTTVEEGNQAVSSYEKARHEVILLDVGLPTIDGYEVCQRIKEIDNNEESSVIFISGCGTVEEKLKGYSVGGDDFITKPVSYEELEEKVRRAERSLKNKKLLAQQSQSSQKMAFNAMKQAAQYGDVLQFTKSMFSCHSYKDISDAIFKLCNVFSLNCRLQIRDQETISMRGPGEPCTPLENSLFELLLAKGRIYSFNHRTMYNADNVSILVTNMPVDDEIQYGLLIDLMAAVIEAGQ